MIRRRLFGIVSAISLLLLVGTCSLIARSSLMFDSFHSEVFNVSTGLHPVIDEISSVKGLLVISHYDTTFGMPAQGVHQWTIQHAPADAIMPLITYEYYVHPYIGFNLVLTDWHNGRSYLVIPLAPFAALFALPVAVWGWVRLRKRRQSKWGCPDCGYNLTGNTSGVCPECGTPVPSKAEAAT